MKGQRTYKTTSRRAGEIAFVDEATVRLIFGQTDVAFHSAGQCETKLCTYCCEPAMKRLMSGSKVETYFSIFELVEA